jgi:excisionase family DNA binding protein
MSLGDLMNVKEVHEQTGICRDVIRRHIRLGRLKTHQFAGRGAHLISPEQLDEWMLNDKIFNKDNPGVSEVKYTKFDVIEAKLNTIIALLRDREV